ncbi:PilW family protein [Vibrio europaeus]|uniref:PilW family protein n=1 Tax=Vibrio europaeus TaxID=300876 RepID=UPI00148D2623|nr:pilus assembly protein PilW [Vibrio europaeus]NOH26272.1 pilus assembly protein PilW [Vibrio europaeus]
MAFLTVRNCRQCGASLVELLIASIMGVMAIGVIGSVFISGQKLATERGKQLLLAQNLSSTLLQIKEDIHRAGFNGVATTPALLSGATSHLYIDNELGVLGYVYRIASTGSASFRNTVYKREESETTELGDSLKLCEKHTSEPLSISSASSSGLGGYCFNLFNPKQISVTEFYLNKEIVKGGEAETRMVTISIHAHLVTDAEITYQANVTTLLRNWQ